MIQRFLLLDVLETMLEDVDLLDLATVISPRNLIDIEPIICTFYKDRSGQELWSGDLVRVQHPTAEPSVTVECVIEYSEYDAAFVFVPRENPESTYPLFGMDSELIERVGSIYEKTER